MIAVDRRHEGFVQLRSGRLLVRRGASNRALLGTELAEFVSRRALRRFETTTTDAELAQADPGLLQSVAAAWGGARTTSSTGCGNAAWWTSREAASC